MSALIDALASGRELSDEEFESLLAQHTAEANKPQPGLLSRAGTALYDNVVQPIKTAAGVDQGAFPALFNQMGLISDDTFARASGMAAEGMGLDPNKEYSVEEELAAAPGMGDVLRAAFPSLEESRAGRIGAGVGQIAGNLLTPVNLATMGIGGVGRGVSGGLSGALRLAREAKSGQRLAQVGTGAMRQLVPEALSKTARLQSGLSSALSAAGSVLPGVVYAPELLQGAWQGAGQAAKELDLPFSGAPSDDGWNPDFGAALEAGIPAVVGAGFGGLMAKGLHDDLRQRGGYATELPGESGDIVPADQIPTYVAPVRDATAAAQAAIDAAGEQVTAARLAKDAQMAQEAAAAVAEDPTKFPAVENYSHIPMPPAIMDTMQQEALGMNVDPNAMPMPPVTAAAAPIAPPLVTPVAPVAPVAPTPPVPPVIPAAAAAAAPTAPPAKGAKGAKGAKTAPTAPEPVAGAVVEGNVPRETPAPALAGDAAARSLLVEAYKMRDYQISQGQQPTAAILKTIKDLNEALDAAEVQRAAPSVVTAPAPLPPTLLSQTPQVHPDSADPIGDLIRILQPVADRNPKGAEWIKTLDQTARMYLQQGADNPREALDAALEDMDDVPALKRRAQSALPTSEPYVQPREILGKGSNQPGVQAWRTGLNLPGSRQVQEPGRVADAAEAERKRIKAATEAATTNQAAPTKSAEVLTNPRAIYDLLLDSDGAVAERIRNSRDLAATANELAIAGGRRTAAKAVQEAIDEIPGADTPQMRELLDYLNAGATPHAVGGRKLTPDEEHVRDYGRLETQETSRQKDVVTPPETPRAPQPLPTRQVAPDYVRAFPPQSKVQVSLPGSENKVAATVVGYDYDNNRVRLQLGNDRVVVIAPSRLTLVSKAEGTPKDWEGAPKARPEPLPTTTGTDAVPTRVAPGVSARGRGYIEAVDDPRPDPLTNPEGVRYAEDPDNPGQILRDEFDKPVPWTGNVLRRTLGENEELPPTIEIDGKTYYEDPATPGTGHPLLTATGEPAMPRRTSDPQMRAARRARGALRLGNVVVEGLPNLPVSTPHLNRLTRLVSARSQRTTTLSQKIQEAWQDFRRKYAESSVDRTKAETFRYTEQIKELEQRRDVLVRRAPLSEDRTPALQRSINEINKKIGELGEAQSSQAAGEASRRGRAFSREARAGAPGTPAREQQLRLMQEQRGPERVAAERELDQLQEQLDRNMRKEGELRGNVEKEAARLAGIRLDYENALTAMRTKVVLQMMEMSDADKTLLDKVFGKSAKQMEDAGMTPDEIKAGKALQARVASFKKNKYVRELGIPASKRASVQSLLKALNDANEAIRRADIEGEQSEVLRRTALEDIVFKAEEKAVLAREVTGSAERGGGRVGSEQQQRRVEKGGKDSTNRAKRSAFESSLNAAVKRVAAIDAALKKGAITPEQADGARERAWADAFKAAGVAGDTASDVALQDHIAKTLGRLSVIDAVDSGERLPLTLKYVQERMPGHEVKDLGDGNFEARTPTGDKVTISSDGTIDLDPKMMETLRETHGDAEAERVLAGEREAGGMYTPLGFDGLINIVERGELSHEIAHRFIDHYATPAEQRILWQEFGANKDKKKWDEAAANHHRDWAEKRLARGPIGKFFHRLFDWFRDAYRTLSGAEPNVTDIWRRIESGKAFDREARFRKAGTLEPQGAGGHLAVTQRRLTTTEPVDKWGRYQMGEAPDGERVLVEPIDKYGSTATGDETPASYVVIHGPDDGWSDPPSFPTLAEAKAHARSLVGEGTKDAIDEPSFYKLWDDLVSTYPKGTKPEVVAKRFMKAIENTSVGSLDKMTAELELGRRIVDEKGGAGAGSKFSLVDASPPGKAPGDDDGGDINPPRRARRQPVEEQGEAKGAFNPRKPDRGDGVPPMGQQDQANARGFEGPAREGKPGDEDGPNRNARQFQELQDGGQAILRIIESNPERFGTTEKGTRGPVRSTDDTRQLALALGLPEKEVLDFFRRAGGLPSKEIFEAAQQHTVENARILPELQAEFDKLDKKMDPTRAEHLSAEIDARISMISSLQEAIVGGLSEAARIMQWASMQTKAYGPEERSVYRLLRDRVDISAELRQEFINALKSGDYERISKARRKIFNPDKMNMFVEWWKAGIFSNPLGIVTNFGGGFVRAGLIHPLVAEVEALLSRAAGKGGRRSGEGFAMLRGMMKGVNAARESAVSEFADDMAALAKGTYEARRLSKAGELGGETELLMRPGALPGKFGERWRAPFHLLEIGDNMWKRIIADQEIYRLAYRDGKNAGKTGSGLDAYITEQVASYGDKNSDIRKKYEPQIKLAQQERTWQGEMSGMPRALQQFVARHPILQLILPVIKTPVNIMKDARQFSPLGIFEAAWSYGKQERVGKNWWQRGDMTPAQLEIAAKSIIGTGILTLVAAAVEDGMIELTGSGSSDWETNRNARQRGWRPYSIGYKRADGTTKYIPYQRIEPFATLLGSLADAREATEAKTQKEFIKKAIAAITENVTNKTFLSGATSFAQALGDPERYMESWWKGMEGSLVPMSGLMGSIARQVDPVQRETDEFGESFQQRIPGWSMSLPAKRTVTGEEEMRTQPFINPLSPSVTKLDLDSKIIEELVRVGKVPGQPLKYHKLKGGKRMDLNDREYAIMQASYKQAAKMFAAEMRRPSYRALPDTKEEVEEGGKSKEHIIEGIWNRAREIGRANLFRDPAFRRREALAQAGKL